jgi:hypothetical protein
MNIDEQRWLVATFAHIESLLVEALDILASPVDRSYFTQYTPDASPAQREVIEDHVRRVRDTMSCVMTDLQISRPPPICGLIWAVRSNVLMSLVSLEELGPVLQSRAALGPQLQQLISYLRQGMEPGG